MPFLGTTGGGSVKQFGGQANLGYFIKNSLRFRGSASAYLSRTPGSAGNRKTWTFSCWLKKSTVVNDGNDVPLLSAVGASGYYDSIRFNSDSTFRIYYSGGTAYSTAISGSPVFRDVSAWYHFVVTQDTTQSTESLRLRVWINGVQQTLTGIPALDYQSGINNSVEHNIGKQYSQSQYFNGYLAEVNFIDGQALTPSSFGKTDAATNQWIPKKFAGTYGTNGFYLKFSDIATTSGSNAGLGKDFSGNSNYWTTNNISVTAGTTYDAMIDSPTRSAAASNYCTLNPLAAGAQWPAMQEGNLRTGDTNVGNYHQSVGSTFAANSGKWYWEITVNGTTWNSRSIGIALANQLAYTVPTGQNAMWNTTSDLKDYRAILIANSTAVTPVQSITGTQSTGTNISLPSTLSGSSVFMVALDVGAGAIWFGLDGTWLKSATTNEIVAGTTSNAVYSNLTSSTTTDFWTPAVYNYIGASSGYGWIANFGQRPFSYTAPSGFKSLNTFNLP